MKCFFHSADMDGYCAGAIIRNNFSGCEMIGVNYGNDDFVENCVVDDDLVFVVDFSLQPFPRMVELNTRCTLVWIDHHKTAIDDCIKSNCYFKGIRRLGIGACALTWEYCFPHKKTPLPVRLLAEYDVWDHTDDKTLLFQYGIRQMETDPSNPSTKTMWGVLLNGDSNLNLIDSILEKGETILEYETSQNKKLCKTYAFKTKFNGYSAICINKGFTNSKVFDSVPKNDCDLLITFCRSKNNKWFVSLYTEKDNIDVGEMAKEEGGGGHRQAAGFQCKSLPFKI